MAVRQRRQPQPTVDPVALMKGRISLWFAQPAPDGTLAAIRNDFATLKGSQQEDILAWLPQGSGPTGERISKIRHVLERALG